MVLLRLYLRFERLKAGTELGILTVKFFYLLLKHRYFLLFLPPVSVELLLKLLVLIVIHFNDGFRFHASFHYFYVPLDYI